MSSNVTAADYADWCEFAGLYLGNVSHADRYRTYQPKISPAGLATIIVLDFLSNNRGGIDVQTWRNSDIYEIGADLAYRVEQTALAMDAIGAPRLAHRIRTAKNTSMLGAFMEGDLDVKAFQGMMTDLDPAKMMEELRANIARAMPDAAAQAGLPVPEKKPVPPDADCETWEQVEHLLHVCVDAHADELRADMARHGDVRAKPGFDPEHRRAELNRMYRCELDRKHQGEEVKKLRAAQGEIEEKLAKNPKLTAAQLAKPRREFLRGYRAYAGRPAADIVPDMRAWLAEAAVLLEKHPSIFFPKPIDDEPLLARLAELGNYEVDVGSKKIKLIWDAPRGLECDWTTFFLSLIFPGKDQATLTALLDAIECVRGSFNEHHAEFRRRVLEHFEIYREMEARFGYEGYELDESGKPTEESILAHAGRGGIHVWIPDDYPDAGITIDVRFPVAWDEEHGLELAIVDEAS